MKRTIKAYSVSIHIEGKFTRLMYLKGRNQAEIETKLVNLGILNNRYLMVDIMELTNE